jgi:transcriptional regulator with XRE-family HTH domain
MRLSEDRSFDAEAVIERAKQLHGFKQDQQLAEFMQLSRTNLASWKRRNSIPAKYLFALVAGTEATVDWLVTGEEDQSVDEFGLSKVKPFVDDHIFWYALILFRLLLTEGNEAERKIAELLDDRMLAQVHVTINNIVTKMMYAKQKWEASGLVKREDVYKAVATEFGIAFFDNPPTPWWQDESIV